MSLARAVLVTLLAAAGTHAALVQESGWLEVHTCAHREEEPYARGSNIVSDLSTSLDPFTAADDPFTTLNAVFARGFDGNLWGRWQVTTREGWGDWVQFGSPNGAGLRHAPVRALFFSLFFLTFFFPPRAPSPTLTALSSSLPSPTTARFTMFARTETTSLATGPRSRLSTPTLPRAPRTSSSLG